MLKGTIVQHTTFGAIIEYVDLMTDTNLLGIPLLLSAIQRPSLSTLPKAFSKPTKNQMQIGTVFSTLLDDYPQLVNVVNARRSRSEACLLMIYAGIKMVFYPICSLLCCKR